MASEEDSKEAHFDKILLQPFNYLGILPKTKMKEKIMKAFNFWFNIPLHKCVEIAEILQMLHTHMLLMDDIEDSSVLRKGLPAAHHIFGVPTVINSARYAYYLILEKVLNLGHPESIKVFTGSVLELYRGQAMDIYWRDNFLCPTENEYKEMVNKKTGEFFGLHMKWMQLFSDNKSDFSKLIAIMGMHFQIRDDYANLKIKECMNSKGFCDDLTEGKFSFPVIHSIRSNLDDPRLMNIIKQRTSDVEIKKYALGIMEETGSFEYCRNVIMDLDAQARKEIESLGHNALLLSFMDELKIV